MVHSDVLDELVGAIYEAGAFPARWPMALQTIAEALGAVGANFIRSTGSSFELVPSPRAEAMAREFEREGWNQHNTRVSRLLERANHPGFLTDSHLHSPEELESLPMYREFLNPRGAAAGAGSIIQGARDDGMVIAIEAFPSHEASREALTVLDRLRPHLARAAVISSEIQAAHAASMLEGFEAVGSAVALLGPSGKAIGMSRRFEAETAELITDGPTRLRMCDPETDRRFAQALARLQSQGKGMSIALRNRAKGGAAVLHLIPARRDARDLFSKVTTFAVLGQPSNQLLPGADIIAALFDLTPAEAKVARAIAEGLTPAELARRTMVSPETVRSQLKRVFAKTSTRRQIELAALLSRLG